MFERDRTIENRRTFYWHVPNIEIDYLIDNIKPNNVIPRFLLKLGRKLRLLTPEKIRINFLKEDIRLYITIFLYKCAFLKKKNQRHFEFWTKIWTENIWILNRQGIYEWKNENRWFPHLWYSTYSTWKYFQLPIWFHRYA